MTAKIQIEGLALALETDDPLPLVVRDQPVVALFEDSTTKEKDSLGQVSDRNSCSDILRLWIGFDQKTSKLFIALAIWIGAKRSRNKNNRTGRLMFLVIPAETLTLKSACDDYDKFAKELPTNISDKPFDDKSGKCKLLRMSFEIDSPNSYVIMPQYKRQANATNQQMALLRKLKSLSESTRFELFTNYDETTSAAIQNLCNIQGGMAVTPSVILEELYSNKQSGCIGMWVAQGWRERDLVRECAVAACKDAGPVNESHDVFGPPQYEPQAPSFRKPLSPQSRHQAPLQAGLAWTGDHPLRTSPDLPSTAPPYSTHAELNSPLHDITYQHASVASPDSRDFPGPATITSLNHGGMLAVSPSRDPTTPAPTPSYDYIATFLSGFSGYSNCVPVVSKDRDGPTSSTNCSVLGRNRGSARTMEEIPFALVEVPATDPGNAAPTFASTPWDITSQIPDSPTRKRRLSQSSIYEMARPANRPFHTSSHAMHGSYGVLSPTVADNLTCHDVQIEPSQVTAGHDSCSLPQRASLLSSWLLEAWKHCPDAHHVLEVELLRLATAINHSTCHGGVTADRVACTFALIDHCTREGSIKCSHGGLDTDRDIATDLLTLTTWLYEMHPKADMEYFSSLSQLSLLVKRSQTNSCQTEDYKGVLRSYRQQKADIVGKACLRYSDELLQKGSEAVGSWMSEKR
jgi:hypothetical protein